jgi:isoamylase
VLRQRLFLHSRPRDTDGIPDLFWRRADGMAPSSEDWHDPAWRTLCVEIRAASATPTYSMSDDVVFVVFNGGEAAAVTLPEPQKGRGWRWLLDTTLEVDPCTVVGTLVDVPAQCVAVFEQVALS